MGNTLHNLTKEWTEVIAKGYSRSRILWVSSVVTDTDEKFIVSLWTLMIAFSLFTVKLIILSHPCIVYFLLGL